MPQNNCKCAYCGKEFYRNPAHIGRVSRSYCNQKCFGLAHRKNKSKKQLVEEKRLYDKKYRLKNLETIKQKKAAYNQTDAGRATQKRNRDKMKGYHLEYCRQPDYVNWKKDYDEIYRAKKNYGEFWECMILVNKIKKKVCELVPLAYDRAKMRGQIQRMIDKQQMRRDLAKCLR